MSLIVALIIAGLVAAGAILVTCAIVYSIVKSKLQEKYSNGYKAILKEKTNMAVVKVVDFDIFGINGQYIDSEKIISTDDCYMYEGETVYL